jgi:hypothetical protein
MSAFGALETPATASPTAAAAVTQRDGSTSFAPALSTGSGSAAGVVPEAAVPVAARSAASLVAVVAGRCGDR